MSITQIIPTIPAAGVRGSATFDADTENILNSLEGLPTPFNTFGSQANALAVTINTDASTASAAALTAAAAQIAVEAASNAKTWVSGQTYALHDVAISIADNKPYRRIIAGAGTTDPSLDGTNWEIVAPNGIEINMEDNLLTRAKLKDTSEALSAIGNVGVTRTFDLTVANDFTATLDQASTFTFSNPVASGSTSYLSITITNGGAFVITWPLSVDWPSGTAPTLTAAGVDILTFKTTNGGTIWLAAKPTLDIK